MERITARADNDFSYVLYGSLWVATLAFIWITCRADPEAPVTYTVEPPAQAEPGWKGDVLQEPSIKVYCSNPPIECFSARKLTRQRSLDRLSYSATPQPLAKPSVVSIPPLQLASTAPLQRLRKRSKHGPKLPSYSDVVYCAPCSSLSSRTKR